MLCSQCCGSGSVIFSYRPGTRFSESFFLIFVNGKDPDPDLDPQFRVTADPGGQLITNPAALDPQHWIFILMLYRVPTYFGLAAVRI